MIYLLRAVDRSTGKYVYVTEQERCVVVGEPDYKTYFRFDNNVYKRKTWDVKDDVKRILFEHAVMCNSSIDINSIEIIGLTDAEYSNLLEQERFEREKDYLFSQTSDDYTLDKEIATLLLTLQPGDVVYRFKPYSFEYVKTVVTDVGVSTFNIDYECMTYSRLTGKRTQFPSDKYRVLPGSHNFDLFKLVIANDIIEHFLDNMEEYKLSDENKLNIARELVRKRNI